VTYAHLTRDLLAIANCFVKWLKWKKNCKTCTLYALALEDCVPGYVTKANIGASGWGSRGVMQL